MIFNRHYTFPLLWNISSIYIFLLFILGLVFCPTVSAQETDTTTTETSEITADTTVIAGQEEKPLSNFIQQIQDVGKKEYLNSQKKFESRKIYLRQHELISQLKEESYHVKGLLNGGINFEEIKTKIDEFKSLIPIASKGIDRGRNELLTERNLTVTSALFNEMVDELVTYQTDLKVFADSFRIAQYRIDSISSEEDLYLFSSDSLEARQYAYLLIEIAKETKPIEDTVNLVGSKIDSLQTSLNELIYDLNSQIENLEMTRKHVNSSIFENEIPESIDKNFFTRKFNEALSFSWEKEKLVLIFYLKLYQSRIIFFSVLCGLIWYFLKSIKIKTEKSHALDEFDDGKIVLRSPLLSSLVISSGLFQFFFPDPPFIFYWIIWFIASVSLTFIFVGYLSRFWSFFWVFTVAIFLVSGIQNMILLPSVQERRIMLVLASIGVLFLVFILWSKKNHQLKEKRILYFIWLMAIMEAISLILNVFGRFNLSKSFLVAGYIGIVVGILLLWTIRLINQSLAIATRLYHNQDKELFFINFDRLGNKAPKSLYALLVLGWLILVGKNFYAFTLISSGISEFLDQDRMIGSYQFSINGLFIFLIILLCSLLISRLLSVFFSDPEVTETSTEQRKRVSFGSWLLLIQIFVICLGLFLAFAASGIPLDKITIILGALSVGIGLGLQGLVNNLVSGLIIAFENTVKVGDLIEIEGKPGIMKSLGFRSSVVNMFEGSTAVIPNGELISKQMINWTTGKGRKLSIIVGVAYGTDLDKALLVLREIVSADPRIRLFPAPRVVPMEFADSSIEIEVTVWVMSYMDYPFVKGDLISKANEAFKQNGIRIPFPQRDLYLKTIPERSEPILPNSNENEQKETSQG